MQNQCLKWLMILQDRLFLMFWVCLTVFVFRHKSKPGCFKLDAPNGPCEKITAGGGIFGVNATTLEVECLKGTDVLSLFDVPKTCPPGSKRDNAKRCRDIF